MVKRIKVGLKAWSLNRQYIKPARILFARGIFDFIELYVHSSSTAADCEAWRGVCPDTRLHAPHSLDGFNPARPEMFRKNCELLKVVEGFRKALLPKSVVFHPGVDGKIEEVFRQFAAFRSLCPEMFEAALVENKPTLGLKDEQCVGSSPAEIRLLIKNTGMGFCLDFGHAFCYAVEAGRDIKAVVKEFLEFDPVLFHVSDGIMASSRDSHLHLGAGDFDLKEVLGYVPDEGCVVIECPHDLKDRLDDFERDVEFLRKLVI